MTFPKKKLFAFALLFVFCFVSFCRAHVLVELFACLEASHCAVEWQLAMVLRRAAAQGW